MAAAQTVRVLLVMLSVPALFNLLLAAPATLMTVPLTSYEYPVEWLMGLFIEGGTAALVLQYIRAPNPWTFGPLLITAAPSTIMDAPGCKPTFWSKHGAMQRQDWFSGDGTRLLPTQARSTYNS
ncbi:AbrB family transcriptional regulator [Pseudomonas sp. RW1P2]|uniref:AbrB family transcriptional regulator n=1 Tax=Pseudomonas kurunegalensis TaxID=485880 RepID=A0ACC5UQI7_9PSED|nr:AbrB family transcriptional regulator [Pseudomonas kurunegalensis]